MTKSVVLICFFICSCSINRRENFDYQKSNNAWIMAYKDYVFYECLKEGIQNDTLFMIMKKRDLFNPYDEIDFSEIDSARLLGIEIIKNMPKPWHCDDCDGNENYISANCLHYYASKDLDIEARAAYKKHIKKRKQVWGKDY